jgi:Family of unknown function (DUF5984)
MKLEFALRPLDEIEPWGDGTVRSLHWFGLTDGFFRLVIGGASVFEYDGELAERLGWHTAARPQEHEDSVDYQLARPFQDLSDLLPMILGESVPDDVAHFVSTPMLRADWENRCGRWPEDESRLELWWTATTWLNRRVLDCGHLVAGPHVYFWRTGEVVHAWCDNRHRKIDGHRVWATDVIYEALPADEFELLIRGFLDGVLASMKERIEFIDATGWKPEGAHLDVERLRRDDAATGRRQEPTDWSGVAAALKAVSMW